MNEFKIYLFRYFYRGSWCQLEIQAVSREDAEDRVKCIVSAWYEDLIQFEYGHPVAN